MKYLLLSLFMVVSCQHRPDIELKRGDQVKIVDCNIRHGGDKSPLQKQTECWYQQCKKLTFLDSQALDDYNVAWVLAEQCPWYQYPELGWTIVTKATLEVNLRDIEKAQ
jgi:hypothetical protein